MNKPRKYKFEARKHVAFGTEVIWADPITVEVMANSRKEANEFAADFLEDKERLLCLVGIEEL